VNPQGLPAPVGFSHGVLARGYLLALAGQVGCDASGRVPAGTPFVDQFDIALGHLVAVVAAAGGVPQDIVKLVLYVTDRQAYEASRAELGAVWRRHFGRYYPAMTLVVVAGLLDPIAALEIDGLAVLPHAA
jgi:enamine deaminase RidA (YjgF/YER057c/UK114 family)